MVVWLLKAPTFLSLAYNLPDTWCHSDCGEISATELNVVIVQQEKLDGIHRITDLPWIFYIDCCGQLKQKNRMHNKPLKTNF